MRDVLVCRCQLVCPTGDRQQLLNALAEAYEGSIGQDPLSHLLHAHKKKVSPLLLQGFPCKTERVATKTRPKRPKKQPKQVVLAAASDTGPRDGTETEQEPDPEQGIKEHPQCRRSERSLSPPPGLHRARAVEVRVYKDLSQHRAWQMHPSGARTVCSNLYLPSVGELSEVVPDVTVLDAHYTQHRNEEPLTLVMSELNGILIWRDYHNWWEACSFVGDLERLIMPNGSPMYIRPGATDLVAALLQMPSCRFVIVSSMGNRHCLPATRMLLEKSLPGKWKVVTDIEGQWTAYRTGQMHEIRDNTIHWYNGDKSRLFIHEQGRCSVEIHDRTFEGSLTADGFLEWDWNGDGGDGMETWVRAHELPPALTCKDFPGKQVHVFDSDSVTERIYDRKELEWVWSALLDSGVGNFDKHSTVLLDDEVGNYTSQPETVSGVKPWTQEEDGSQMLALRDYLLGLILTTTSRTVCGGGFASCVSDACRHSTVEYMKQYKCPAFQ